MTESVVFISHEATLTGAPILLLNLIKDIKPFLKKDIIVILGKDGPLRAKFEQIATVVLYEQKPLPRLQAALLRRMGSLSEYQDKHFRRQLQGRNIKLVFSNTIVNWHIIKSLQLPDSIPVVTYVHELRFTIDQQQLAYGNMTKIIHRTDFFLAGSNAVKEELLSRDVEDKRIQVIFSSVKFDELYQQVLATDTKNIRNRIGLEEDAKIVVAIGTASWRKGNDWFIEMASYLCKDNDKLHFIWVGVSPNTLEYMQMNYDITNYGLTKHFTLVPVTSSYLDYLAIADVFVLSSREDPFPLVVLEAAVAGKPIVCFDKAGGAPEFVGEVHGAVVPYGNVLALAKATNSLLCNPLQSQAMGVNARETVRKAYTTDGAAAQIVQVISKLVVNKD